jgi:hypothetical protein
MSENASSSDIILRLKGDKRIAQGFSPGNDIISKIAM